MADGGNERRTSRPNTGMAPPHARGCGFFQIVADLPLLARTPPIEPKCSHPPIQQDAALALRTACSILSGMHCDFWEAQNLVHRHFTAKFKPGAAQIYFLLNANDLTRAPGVTS